MTRASKNSNRDEQKVHFKDVHMKKIFIGLLALVTFSSCGGQLTPPAPNQVVLSERTKVLGTAPKNLTVQAFSDATQYVPELLWATSELEVISFVGSSSYARSLRPGDVISAPPNQVAAEGFLRKVLSVADYGSEVHVQTEEAELDEAIEVADTDQAMNLAQDDLISVSYADGRVLNEQQLRQLRPQATTNLGDIDLPISGVNLCQGVNGNSITGSGALKASLKAFLKVKFGFFSIKEIKTGIEGTQNLNLRIGGQCQFTFIDKDITLAKMKFRTRVVWVGPIPVVITPYYNVNLKAKGTITLSAGYNVSQSFTGRYGAKWRKGEDTSVLNEATFNVTGQDSVSASAAVAFNFSINAEAGLKFYGGLVTLFIYAKPYLDFNATVATSAVNYTLHAGLNVGLGGRAKIFGKNLGSVNLLDVQVVRILVASTSTTTPPPSTTPPPTTPRPPRPCENCQIQ
jgi:hypothetical protein